MKRFRKRIQISYVTVIFSKIERECLMKLTSNTIFLENWKDAETQQGLNKKQASLADEQVFLDTFLGLTQPKTS